MLIFTHTHTHTHTPASGLRIRLGDPLDQSISASAACFAATSSNEVILVCGFWDNSFKCFAADSSKPLNPSYSLYLIVTLALHSYNYLQQCYRYCVCDLLITQVNWYRVCLVIGTLSVAWTSPLREVSMATQERGWWLLGRMMLLSFYGGGQADRTEWWG